MNDFPKSRSWTRRRVITASTLAILVLGAEWLTTAPNSPFNFLSLRLPLDNFWVKLNFVPYLIAFLVSGNVHQGSTAALGIAMFIQWFAVFFLLYKAICKVPQWLLVSAAVIGCLLVALSAWYVESPERMTEEALKTRFRNLRLGLSESEAASLFGAPDLKCTNKKFIEDGQSRDWDFYYLFPRNHGDLVRQTESRWLYFHPGPNFLQEEQRRSQCLPAKWDTELGVTGDGRVIWFRRMVGVSDIEPGQ